MYWRGLSVLYFWFNAQRRVLILNPAIDKKEGRDLSETSVRNLINFRQTLWTSAATIRLLKLPLNVVQANLKRTQALRYVSLSVWLPIQATTNEFELVWGWMQSPHSG